MKSNCAFVSVWDGGVEVRTQGYFDERTGYVESLEMADIGGLDVLEREYIELPNGETKEVCPQCHEFILHPVVVEDLAGKGLMEGKECCNPICDNKL